MPVSFPTFNRWSDWGPNSAPSMLTLIRNEKSQDSPWQCWLKHPNDDQDRVPDSVGSAGNQTYDSDMLSPYLGGGKRHIGELYVTKPGFLGEGE
jgi:hypothetical protein